MQVKGVTHMTRAKEIADMFGEQKWQAFLDGLKGELTFLQQPVFPTSRIPLSDFLTFQERMIQAFFNNNSIWYWTLGKNAAKWSFTEGPFKSAAETEFSRFVAWGPTSVWKSYYDFGDAKAWLEDGHTLHIQLVDLPKLHPHFELGVMGFIEGVIEVFTDRSPTFENLTPSGQERMVHYVFKF